MTDTPRIRTVASLSIVFVLFLAACSSSIPRDLQTIEAATQDPTIISPTATVTPVAISPSATAEPQPMPSIETATAPALTPVVGPPRCLETLERRLVNEQRPGGERYTLSFEEFDAYLDLMGIESLCVPEQFEEPFLNVDWNDFGDPQIAIGRMVSIGFDGLYPGLTAWSSGYIIYSTYDFEVGSEYVVFASEEDRDRVIDQSMPNPITVGGADGFTRFQKGLNYGTQLIHKAHIFPFESHYIAFVVNIGHYDPDDVDDVVRQMEIGAHPDLLHNNVRLMDYLVSSLQFSDSES